MDLSLVRGLSAEQAASVLQCSPLEVVRARFMDKVAVQDLDSCWVWVGKIKKRTGYGTFSYEGREVGSHRMSFFLHYGWFPTRDESGSRLVVRHLCDNPPCCNPHHLVSGTYKQNYDDSVRSGRARGFAVLTPAERSLYGTQAARAQWPDGPKYTQNDLDRCAGLSVRESASMLGCSRSTVSALRAARAAG